LVSIDKFRFLSLYKSKLVGNLNLWIYIENNINVQKIIKFNPNFTTLNKLILRNWGFINNYLILNFKKNLKVSFNSLNFSKNWVASIGVVLKVLKLGLKSEKKIEKNKTLFINYIFKYILGDVKSVSVLCKYFSLNLLIFLKKLNFFKKIRVVDLIFFVKLGLYFKKRVRRIKRRLKKRLLGYNS